MTSTPSPSTVPPVPPTAFAPPSLGRAPAVLAPALPGAPATSSNNPELAAEPQATASGKHSAIVGTIANARANFICAPKNYTRRDGPRPK